MVEEEWAGIGPFTGNWMKIFAEEINVRGVKEVLMQAKILATNTFS